MEGLFLDKSAQTAELCARIKLHKPLKTIQPVVSHINAPNSKLANKLKRSFNAI